MPKEGFHKFFWGFLFIMIDFRLQGFDILPDVIGFILFAIGFQTLAEHSDYFVKGKTFNLIMLVVSVFGIYERPAQGGGVHINPLGIVLGLVSLVLLLTVVYHLLMGAKEMAARRQRSDLEQEVSQKWTYFLVFQLAGLVLFILILIPPVFILMVIILFVAAIVLTIMLMGLMKKCGEQL